MKRHMATYVPPELGKLYATRFHFRFLVKRHNEAPLSYVIKKGTPLMLVELGQSLGMKGYNYRRQWLDDEFRDDPGFDVGGTVWVYTFLYEDKAWEIGFREGDWGDTIKLWRPNRNNHGTD